MAQHMAQPSTRDLAPGAMGHGEPDPTGLPRAHQPRTLPFTGIATLALTLIPALWIASSAPVFAQSASTLLASLPTAAQEEVKKLCLPMQFSGGAAAYRACVTQDVTRRQAGYDNPTLAAFDALSFDDKLAIQQLCPASSATSVYQSCLSEQINRLSSGEPLGTPPTRTIVAAALPANSTSSAPTVTDSTSDSAIVSSQNAGAAEPAAETELPPLATVVENVSPAVSTATESTTATLVSATGNDTLAVTDEFQSDSVTPTSVTTTRVISSPQPNEAIEPEVVTDNAAVTAVETTPAPAPIAATEVSSITATTAAQNTTLVDGDTSQTGTSVLNQFGNLQPEQIRTGLLYGVPVLLLLLLAALVSVFRKKRAQESMVPYSPEQSRLDDSVRFTEQRYDQFDDTDQPLELDLGEDTAADLPLQQRTAVSASATATIDHSIQINLDELPAQGEDPTSLNDITATLGDLDTNMIETGVVVDPESHTLGSWLSQFPVTRQKEYIIEYLLYWISYGEGNYDPVMKAELLQTRELSEHDQIKRWVLLQDGESFTDALKFCQTTFDSTEIEQILNLVFAVLVKHEATPVQTAFLRFFADINGIGATSLGLRYERAFGRQLPPMPRPDNIRWWNRLAEESRGYQGPDHAYTTRDQNLDILGLMDPVSDKAVISAFEQITDRFDPVLFDQLGDKEKALVARHLDHYTQAYRSLTGETV